MKLVAGNPLGWSNSFHLNFNRKRIHEAIDSLRGSGDGTKETITTRAVLELARSLSMITQTGAEEKKAAALKQQLQGYLVEEADLNAIAQVLLVARSHPRTK